MRRSPSVARRAAWLLTFAVAAASAQSPASPPLDVHGAWRIEQARTEPIYDRALARVDFGPEGQLSGHTSCKPMIASYTLAGDRLQVGPVRTGTARCSRLQLEQEDRILSALEAASTARVRPDGLLELRDADGRGVLRATRWDAAK